MPDFYYQIKGKADDLEYSMSSWAFPPLFSGKVTAKDRKEAKLLVEDEYGREFPTRVLKKDLDNHNFLLKITEIKPEDERTRSLFEFIECKYEHCNKKFRIIDLYNDHNQRTKGQGFCSDLCADNHRARNYQEREVSAIGAAKPVIYRIYNSKTCMAYIGKTTQVFTLRWYQHFFQGSGTKFHKAIFESNLEDWEFSILESVSVPHGIDVDEFVSSREAFWIQIFDSINNGYNTSKVSLSGNN
jgi:hypothetical protein